MSDKDNDTTRKWLTNACEDVGVCEMRTEAFIPIDNFQEIIEAINVLYQDNRTESNHVLFTYKENDDGKIIVHGSTYLLGACDEDMNEWEESETTNLLEEDQIPGILHKQMLAITQGEVPVGDFIELMVAPKQSILVQITDVAYGNHEYTIEK